MGKVRERFASGRKEPTSQVKMSAQWKLIRPGWCHPPAVAVLMMLIWISLLACLSPPDEVIRARTTALTTEPVDGLGNVGHMNSIAVDSYDNIHISYYDYTNLDLKYATNANGSWYTSTIDSEGIVGSGSSIAVDSSDNVHISYLNYTDLDLKYATTASGTWSAYTVASTGGAGKFTSIAIDSDGKVHISHFDDADFDLEYTTNAGGSWTTYTVDSADVGQFTSLAVDSADKIHISYEDMRNWDLKYATNFGGSWVTYTVDSIGVVGHGTSLFVDSHDYIHIGYYDYTNGDLKYATNASGSWTTYTVDSAGDVGQSPSIAVDSSDRIFISYYDGTNDDLKCAMKEGSSWTNYTVDSAGDVGQFTSIAVDSADNIHISYYDYTNGDLRYARIEGPGIEGLKSFVGSLAPFQTISSFSVPYIASDLGGSELAYVELYYRLGTSGTFTLYTTGANPSGQWTASPIVFDSSGVGGDGQYQFYTCAVDVIGNHEDPPPRPDSSTTVDTTPPSLTIASPTEGSYVNDAAVLSWQSSDNVGIAKEEVRLDVLSWQTLQSGLPIYAPEGEHTINVRVTDLAGNQVTKGVNFTKDISPPTLTFLSPLEGSYTSGNLVEWRVNDNYVVVAYYEMSIDDGDWFHTGDGVMYYSMNIPDGPHSIRIRLTDVAGNPCISTVNFTFDTTRPTLTILTPAQGATIRGNYVTLTWQTSDNIAVKEVRVWIDGQGGEVVEGNELTDIRLANGQHTIKIWSYDRAGNFDGIERTFTMNSQAFSFGGPYYGLPTVGLILVVVVAAIAVTMMLRKRRGGPAVTSVLKEDPSPGTL